MPLKYRGKLPPSVTPNRATHCPRAPEPETQSLKLWDIYTTDSVAALLEQQVIDQVSELPRQLMKYSHTSNIALVRTYDF